MTDSVSEDDGSEEGSRHEEESEYGDDDVEVVQASGSRASVKPILRLPERNDEVGYVSPLTEDGSTSIDVLLTPKLSSKTLGLGTCPSA